MAKQVVSERCMDGKAVTYNFYYVHKVFHIKLIFLQTASNLLAESEDVSH